MKKRFCFFLFFWSVPIISGPKLPLLFGLSHRSGHRQCGDLRYGPSLCLPLPLPLLFCIFCILRDFMSAFLLCCTGNCNLKLQSLFLSLYSLCKFLFVLRLIGWHRVQLWFYQIRHHGALEKSEFWWSETYLERSYNLRIWQHANQVSI